MATRQVLADLLELHARQGGPAVLVESIGGVDAARRVQAGESFDVVFLASKAIDELIAAGKVLPGSRVDLVKSGVAVAVPTGAQRPDIGSEQAVRDAVMSARTLGYSTGPSGVALVKLFERWGIASDIQGRIVQAPAGVPVGSLVAKGEVALGFQQLSELTNLPGIDVLGPLPPEIQIITTFSAGVCATSRQPDAVRALLQWLADPVTAGIKQRNGMDPA